MEESKPKPYAISKKILLAVYGAAPLLMLLMLADMFFFKEFLKNTVTITATNAAIYILFLEMPHIMASFISYADKEYVQFYKKRVLLYLPLLLLTMYFIVQINLVFAFLLYAIYTAYHAIKQQTGIAGMLVGKISTLHKTWSWFAIIAIVLGNFLIFTPQFIEDYTFFTPFVALTVSTAIALVVSFFYIRTLDRKTIGFAYVLATTLMLFSGYIFIYTGYLFFSIVLIRFVHDLTAFIFYTVHDSNRNFDSAKNVFYKVFKPFRVPLVIVTPILGVLVAYYFQKLDIPFATSGSFALLLGFAHYYIESFMWKRESIHRKQLRFVE